MNSVAVLCLVLLHGGYFIWYIASTSEQSHHKVFSTDNISLSYQFIKYFSLESRNINRTNYGGSIHPCRIIRIYYNTVLNDNQEHDL